MIHPKEVGHLVLDVKTLQDITALQQRLLTEHIYAKTKTRKEIVSLQTKSVKKFLTTNGIVGEALCRLQSLIDALIFSLPKGAKIEECTVLWVSENSTTWRSTILRNAAKKGKKTD